MCDGNISDSVLLGEVSSQAVFSALRNVKVPELERYALLEDHEANLGSSDQDSQGDFFIVLFCNFWCFCVNNYDVCFDVCFVNNLMVVNFCKVLMADETFEVLNRFGAVKTCWISVIETKISKFGGKIWIRESQLTSIR